MFITHAYSETTNSYYTTSFSIMQTKKEKDYIKVFQKIHNNINLYLDIGEKYKDKEIHTDFGYAISNTCQKVYPNVKKKFFIFHMIKALDINKNKICLNDINENDNLFILYNIITSLYLCNTKYIKDVFELVKRENK